MIFILIIVFLIKNVKKKYILLNQSMYFLFYSKNYVPLVHILKKKITAYSPHTLEIRFQTL